MYADLFFLSLALPYAELFVYGLDRRVRTWTIYDNYLLGSMLYGSSTLLRATERSENSAPFSLTEELRTWWIIESDTITDKLLAEAIRAQVRTIICPYDLFDTLTAHLDTSSVDTLVIVRLPVTQSVTRALSDAAREWRKRLYFPLVAIGGSTGKTTTKEMIRAIVDHEQSVPIYVQSLNGDTLEELACSILSLGGDYGAAVFEIAITAPGETAPRIELLQPTLALITAVTHSYGGHFSSLEECAAEHRTLFATLSPTQIGIICGDSPLLDTAAYSHPVVRFGMKHKNHVRGKRLKTRRTEEGEWVTEGTLLLHSYETPFRINCPHKGSFYAALGAAAVAYFLNISLDVIEEGIAQFRPYEGRFSPRSLKAQKGLCIDDTYNASPESLKYALQAVEEMDGYSTKIAVLGNMDDLGDQTSFWHRQIGRELIKARSIRHLVLVGEHAHKVAETAPVTMKLSFASDWRDAYHSLIDKLSGQDAPLVFASASRKLQLNALLDAVCV